MKFWTNIATLLVVSVCATEDKEESFGRHRSSLVEIFDLDTFQLEDIREDEQEIERFLGIGGLSMSFVPTVTTRAFGKAKDGKSKSKDGKSKSKDGQSKSKDGKSKSKDGVRSKSNKDSKTLRNVSKSKSGKESDEKEGGKEGQKKPKVSDEVKTRERIVVTKNEKGRRVLGIGFAERIEMDKGKSKSGKAKSGKAKSGKAKSGKKGRQIFVMDMNKLSLPSSSKTGKTSTIPPNRKLTPAPSGSPVGKTGSKGNSRRYKVRRRAAQTSDAEMFAWKSNHRELGDHCLIGNPLKTVGIGGSLPGSKEGSKSGSKSGSKEGTGYGSKEGSKSGSKEGTKSGSKGGIGRRDRGRRRTEIGLYACYLSGSWTCCKEYGDMGDDPVCCKGDYVEPVVGRISPSNSKTTSSSSNVKSSGTSTIGVTSASRGPERVNPSYSNDLPPPVLASPGFGGNPSMGRAPQDPITMKVVHDWQSNDQQMN